MVTRVGRIPALNLRFTLTNSLVLGRIFRADGRLHLWTLVSLLLQKPSIYFGPSSRLFGLEMSESSVGLRKSKMPWWVKRERPAMITQIVYLKAMYRD